MKKTKEEASQTRQAVLAAALKTFGKYKYSGTSLEAVAKEAGMTRGAIYWHFKNKFELLHAVIEDGYRKADERINRVLQSSDRPLNKVRQLIREFILIISGDDEFRVMEELLVFKIQRKKELSRLYTEHMEHVSEIKTWMKTLIMEGIAAGEIDPNVDPEIVVVAWISFVAGIKTAWLSDVKKISLKENAEDLANVFINGIARRD
jgi:TetR/AcrR family acrAB operon transcriptional repressor